MRAQHAEIAFSKNSKYGEQLRKKKKKTLLDAHHIGQ